MLRGIKKIRIIRKILSVREKGLMKEGRKLSLLIKIDNNVKHKMTMLKLVKNKELDNGAGIINITPIKLRAKPKKKIKVMLNPTLKNIFSIKFIFLRLNVRTIIAPGNSKSMKNPDIILMIRRSKNIEISRREREKTTNKKK